MAGAGETHGQTGCSTGFATLARRELETGGTQDFMSDDSDMVEATMRATLVDILGLDEARVAAFDEHTALFGALPELDSMAVATLLTELEDRLGITIDDDEVDVEMFESFGALVRFAVGKALN